MSIDLDVLSEREYARLSQLIYEKAGIHLGSERKVMLGARIQRRIKALNMTSFAEYCAYVFSVQGQKHELSELIDVVTTNKTDFFREPAHFDYLMQKALPEMAAANEKRRPLLIWSAGCSTGEEPYTLAMLLSEFGQAQPGFQFRVLATDISNTVLSHAHTGIFTNQAVAPVPPHLRKKYLMRSRNHNLDQIRVVPELRRLVEFRHLNFMDADYGIDEKADAIFCRNVIIYFDRPTQREILLKLSRHLMPGGFMFVGHAESLHDMNLPLTAVAPALYRKDDIRGR